MDNITDILTDLFLTLISGSAIMIGLDSIPVPANETLIKVILSPSAESGLDVTNKITLLLSTLIACVSGSITIYKARSSFFKKQK
ncbi:hypothetical protein N9924_00115 [bacterium]|nr:hypothetical protein [bacterium]